MRFSSLAVLVSALVALPLTAAVMAPMDGAAFVESARCAAVESMAGEASFAPARVNAEAQRQPEANVNAARAVIADVVEHARSQGPETLRAMACNAA